jgi:hypothetical protein
MNYKFDELARCSAQRVTRRQALKTFGLGLGGMALARLGLNEAQAITNGQLDGDAHPNVGGFVWLESLWPPATAPLVVGSGSLIHPRVVLTAGHGTYLVEMAIANGMMTLDDLLISFASDATNPATWRAISAVLTHPGYADKPEGNGNVPVADVGVAILKEPVSGLPLMPLPPPGFLDALQANGQLREGFNPAKFTVVGYGVELGPDPGHLPFPPDGLRRVGESNFRELHERWLFLDINVAHDLGGTASGDSGGPTFWVDPATGAETLVAIVSRGSTAHDARYRVDTAEALTFLSQVIARVEAGDL